MKKFLFFFLIIVSNSLFAQKEASFWYFGKNAGLDFSSGEPVSLSNGKLTTDEGCSSIADKNGNLLFYSDGISVYTKNHELMKYTNGSLANNLKGNPSSTQSGLIVPNPEDKNIYYIFTVGTEYVGENTNLPINPGFNYYSIDISKGNGGEIIAGPINLSNGRDEEWSEKITAVQSENCNEIWVLSIVDNTFYAYKISKNGVNTNPVKSATALFLKDKRGYLKVSPDGTKIAIADYNAYTTKQGDFFSDDSSLTLFDFDALTGKVSNVTFGLISPKTDGAPYGVEFSQNSTKLYTSTHDGTNNKVYQFDVTAEKITTSKKLIHKKTGFRGALQLAPNGKIYATVPESYKEGTQFLDVIDNVDNLNANYTSNALKLNGTSTQGLPPFIQSFFAPVKILNTDSKKIINNKNHVFCTGNSYKIQPEINDPSATYTWYKDTKKIATTKILTINNTNYGSGIYEVTIESNNECKKTYTGKVQISFKPKPIINKIPTYVQCDFDNNPIDGFTTFNLSSKITELISDTSTITINFYEVSDTSFQNPINKKKYINTVATNHQILVKATNKGSNCYQTEIINLQVNPSGVMTYANEYTCELDANENNLKAKFSEGTNNGAYNFSLKTKKIITNSNGVLSENTHIFQYYRSAEDASLQINEVTSPYKNDVFENNSNVFVRISDKGTNSCETIGSFKIFIKKLPVPQGNLTPKILCVDNPKRNPQTKTISLNADTGNSTDSYKWYLNGKLTKKNSSLIEVNKEGEYRVEAYRTYPNISEKCMGYNTFYVKESNKALLVKVITQDDQDNPDSNIIKIEVDGVGDYEYALDNDGNYQFIKGDKNLNFTFKSTPTGLNKIHIRDRNGCGTISSSEISIIYFQRHFTPNGDGYADTWNILGINNDFYDVVNVQIFNRQGKLLKEITDKFSNGWDGIYNGTPLPSNDYWFNAKLIDRNGKIRNKKGHFSLLRK